jgi:ribonuclease D
VGLRGHCYVFDLTKINPFPLGLKSILESQNIVKIFHDFCEDTSALVNQFGVHCERVFDTQIAHRLFKSSSENPKDSNISLNALLQSYLGVEND